MIFKGMGAGAPALDQLILCVPIRVPVHGGRPPRRFRMSQVNRQLGDIQLPILRRLKKDKPGTSRPSRFPSRRPDTENAKVVYQGRVSFKDYVYQRNAPSRVKGSTE